MVPIFTFQKIGSAYFLETFLFSHVSRPKRKCILSRGAYCLGNIAVGGKGAIVEMDESKFMHWKYHRGHWTEGQWVLGLIEHDTLNTVLVPIEDRSAQTLQPIIARHVLPNTRIVTDD